MKIMIVEDEELLLQAISKKLSTLGFDTVSCTTALQALDYLKDSKNLPDAIWLDYYLEDMNGLEFMQKIKENPNWSSIPVIVVSNSASDEKRNSMLALGVRKYLLKSEHRLDEIAETIQEVVRLEQHEQKE